MTATGTRCRPTPAARIWRRAMPASRASRSPGRRISAMRAWTPRSRSCAAAPRNGSSRSAVTSRSSRLPGKTPRRSSASWGRRRCMPPGDRRWPTARSGWTGASSRCCVSAGRSPSRPISRALRRREEFWTDVQRFLARFDLLITPTVAVPPFGDRSPRRQGDQRSSGITTGLAAVHLPVQPDRPARCHGAGRLHVRGPAGGIADRRPASWRANRARRLRGVRGGRALGRAPPPVD